MQTRTVSAYRAPQYPTRLEVLDEPALLARHLPPAWLARPELHGAVALFLAANLTACGGPVNAAEGEKAKGPATAPAGAAIVAPIFEHGEGRGVTGCVAVSPPVFLSEQEALQVIKEELDTRGVKLTKAGAEVAGVSTPLYAIQPKYIEKQNKTEYKVLPASKEERESTARLQEVRGAKGPKPGEPFQIDALDPQRRIAVEFVANGQQTTFGYLDENGKMVMSTVSYHAPRDIAATLAGHIKAAATDRVYVGTFYDPAAPFPRPQGPRDPKDKDGWAKAWKEAGEKGREEAKKLLREQVKDFADWLKAQGAI